MITKEWRILEANNGKFFIRDANGMGVCEHLTEANAQFIVEAHNQAIKINKDNPMAVIEGMGDVIEALKRFLESSACANGCNPNDMTCDTSFARNALSKVEEK